MAKATSSEKTVKVTKAVEVEETKKIITLELTEQEALVLKALLGGFDGGGPIGEMFSDIFNELVKVFPVFEFGFYSIFAGASVLQLLPREHYSSRVNKALGLTSR